jgi:tryptophan halogenase
MKELTTWRNYNGLPNNSAVWGPIKNLQLYKPATEAVAQDAGWMWITPTLGQVGTGYVFSDNFITEDAAIQTLENIWRKKGYKWEPFKSIKFSAGRLEEMSCKNTISNGLGQSFIEPLEATSIMVTCVTAMLFSRIYNKHKKWDSKLSAAHNKIMVKFLENTKDFVKYHYLLTERTDNDYWLQFKNNTAVQEVCNKIDERFKTTWTNKGQTLLNQWNWTSMLVGYNKPYTNLLPNLHRDEIAEYINYTKLLISNYKFLNKNNLSIKEVLESLK